MVATEALVRWNHPTRGLLLPDSFIAVAEQTNLAGELGRLVLRMACAQLSKWRSSGLANDILLRVTSRPCNSSPTDSSTASQIPSKIRPRRRIDMPGDHRERRREGHRGGPHHPRRPEGRRGEVAIDDFGTGYSVLSHLKSLPVDTLKIDRSFVTHLGRNPGDLAIVRAIIALANAFELQVVAEGVETEDAATTLLRLGCFHAQGFLLSRPVDHVAMARLLTDRFVPFSLNGREDATPRL